MQMSDFTVKYIKWCYSELWLSTVTYYTYRYMQI